MKVKYIATALVNDSFLKITKGKEYQVLARKLNSICIYDDCSDSVWMNVSKFKISETPQIEVGSEWVDGEYECKIKYVGKNYAIYEYNNGEEGISPLCEFNRFWKPKPKTVTMYFYKTTHGYVAYSDKHPFDAPLFTKEIEL